MFSSSDFFITFGSQSILTPSASRQSAVPHFDEAARLPCLTIVTSAAAATKAEVVEILKEFDLSPPVPTISRAWPPILNSIAFERIPVAAPAISSSVSPFIASAVRNEDITASLTSPLIISSIACFASSNVRSCFADTFASNSLIILLYLQEIS